MSRGLADTSLVIARGSGRSLDVDALPDELAVSVITIGELRAGVLAAATVDVRDRRLATLTAALRSDPVPVDESVAAEWARLRVLLRDRGQRMPSTTRGSLRQHWRSVYLASPKTTTSPRSGTST